MFTLLLIGHVLTLISATSSAAVANYSSSCTISQFSDVKRVTSSCNNIVIKDLRVPGGKQLKLDLKRGSKLVFEGTTVFDVAHWHGPLVLVTGENVQVNGAKGSVLNAQGEKYWDGQGGAGGVTKPRFFTIETTGGSVFKNIKLLNCAMFCVGIHSTDLHLDGWTLDVSAGHKLGKNTDGFGISENSRNILIENSVVTNQDDCVVVNSGSNMLFRNIKCHGSHGLSFSLGKNDDDNADSGTTRNITFNDISVADGSYGIHVKTKRGNGLLTDIIYENIEFKGLLKEGIFIDQNYGTHGKVPRKFQISNLKLINVHGTVNKKATPVHISCHSNGCSNFDWSKIDVRGSRKNICNFNPTGFSC